MEEACQEKWNNDYQNCLAAPAAKNQDYKFGRLLGEGAYAVVRLA